MLKKIFFFSVFSVFIRVQGQMTPIVEKINYFSGFQVEKGLNKINDFDLGYNYCGSRGRLTTGVINYFGVESGFSRFTYLNSTKNALSIRAVYQRVRYPVGLNFIQGLILNPKQIYYKPEIGLNVYGVISINFGYLFGKKDFDKFNNDLMMVSVKFNVNKIYLSYMNMVGFSKPRIQMRKF